MQLYQYYQLIEELKETIILNIYEIVAKEFMRDNLVCNLCHANLKIRIFLNKIGILISNPIKKQIIKMPYKESGHCFYRHFQHHIFKCSQTKIQIQIMELIKLIMNNKN